MRYSWNKMFIEIAKVVAKRSADPKTQVGAVLVKNKCVIGVGYNGEPRQFKYKFDWNSDEKYDYVIHSELNALANANANGVNCTGADIYLTLSPCHDCIKLLIQHGIRNVYFLEKYRDFDLTKKIADGSGLIQLIQLDEKNLDDECIISEVNNNEK